MLGYRPNFSDQPWVGSSGVYDSVGKVISFGIIAPIICLALAIVIILTGGVTLSSQATTHRYSGFSAVYSSVMFLMGVALLFGASFLLPNIFRNSYRYQYFAGAGICFMLAGIIWFVVAAFL